MPIKYMTFQGKLKSKRLAGLVSSLKDSALGPYGGGSYTSGSGQTVTLNQVSLSLYVHITDIQD